MSNDSDSDTSKEDARAFVEAVSRSKGTFTDAFKQKANLEAKNGREGMLQAIEGGEEIREDLVKALEIISADLYTNRARFLMELVQNADDNRYDWGVIPTISITVVPHHVKIECNEKGFSRKNVRALCRTGRSSKAHDGGYTGEKGIGFKSVFKLAERAHIRSSSYCFQLDQRRVLGMITPQWDEDFFADHKKEYQTTIILDGICSAATDFSTALKDDVDAIDPVLLLFLRRIRRLHLALYKSGDKRRAISKRFQRLDWTLNSGIVSLRDEDANAVSHFYKHRFTARFYGTESRRPNVTDTDIVLAFAVKEESGKFMPLMRKQNFAFAYLPLGNFGFKFVIQADFLTTSNRQSVDEDNHWNQNIADAIPHAFETAIQNFNSNDRKSDLDELAKTWPLYLSDTAHGPSAYWRRIVTSIKTHLRRARVIRNRIGGFDEPRRLMFLDWAHDRHGEPIFGQKSDFVSADYPDSVRAALLSLDVATPDWSWVCAKLQQLHGENLLHMKMQNMQWCVDLAEVILTPNEPMRSKTYARDMRRIPLIPMTDGNWRCPPSEHDPIYFPASLGTTIPPGLPLSMVDKEACSYPKMKHLFRLLGVKDCDVRNIINRISDYHANLRSAQRADAIAQLRYLYNMREYLRPGDVRKIYFSCSNNNYLRHGTLTYADISVGGELRQLFSAYTEAYFLENDYFEEFDASEKSKFVEWLDETAGVALAPRLIATDSDTLHSDFRYLLDHQNDQVLAILQQHWGVYSKRMTNKSRETLAGHDFMCRSGGQAALRKTYVPLPDLLEATRAFGNVNDCHFLVLPYGNANDWKFLSSLGVGLSDDLEFYLWILHQRGFKDNNDINKAKQLYLAIQSRAFSPIEEGKVRKAFENALVPGLDSQYMHLKSCVWHAPKGFSSQPVLQPIYGRGLYRLFREILKVPNLTNGEAWVYLRQLRDDQSTTMADVAEIYVYLQDNYANRFTVDNNSPCIAVPSLPGSALEWKTPAQCVWDDNEFSQNGIELESKTAVRHAVEQHAPIAKSFFIDTLNLRDAGIDELLVDLALMQEKKRNDPKRVYRLYERIESCRRSCSRRIREAFEKRPIVFIRGMNDQSGQWVPLKDCIWVRSILRNKHALMPSLNQYRGLFRDTLEVPNATTNMLVTDFLEHSMASPMEDEGGYQYRKELLQEIARAPQNDKELKRLEDKKCWPCHTPTRPRELCSIGKFYVNDRQDLFDIFSSTQTFLDFDFDDSRKVAGLLRHRGCNSFLSGNVSTQTESCEPLEHDPDLTQSFRGRADALLKYFEHVRCESPYNLRQLLQNVNVWRSAEIKTHYKLQGITVTKREGGSSVEVSIVEDQAAMLKIYVSADRSTRDCALVTDVPEQLAATLKIKAAELHDLHTLLQVPVASLKAFLVKKGIVGRYRAKQYEEVSAADSPNQDSQDQKNGSSDDESNDESTTSARSVRSDLAGLAVIESTRASARSEAANVALRPRLDHKPNSGLTAFEPQREDCRNAPSDDGLHEPPGTSTSTAASLFSTDNRNRNRERIQGFARNAEPASGSRPTRLSAQADGSDNFDTSILRENLEVARSAAVSMPCQVNFNSSRRAGWFPNRTTEERIRDFEVGFLGEQFVYTLLHDTLGLPNFTGNDNWTSSLRSRAGFLPCDDKGPDFTYKDSQGTLTGHFLRMRHQYATPEWLFTACNDSNAPLYLLEVKSTTSQDPTTPFYMSGNQYELAKKMRITSATPSMVYVVLRVSSLDALEDEATHQPQWRVYLDPYTRSEEGVLNFVAPKYAVTVTA